MKTSVMIFILLWWAISISGSIYLVVNGHPWFALFIMILSASIRVKWD